MSDLSLLMQKLSSLSAESPIFALTLPLLDVLVHLDKPKEMLRLIRACEDLAIDQRAVSVRELRAQAFGDHAPGASPGIPFRSADVVVSDSKAGPAPAGGVRVMSDFVHQLGNYFATASIGTVQLASGQEVVRIEFKAPGRFGLLGTSAR